MKGIIIMSDASEIIFWSADTELTDRLKEKTIEKGLHNTVNGDIEADLRDYALLNWLQPQKLAFDCLSFGLNNPLQYSKTDDGVTIVYQKLDAWFYVGIDGDETVQEDTILRKIRICHQLIRLHYGLSLSKFANLQGNERQNQWQYFDSLIKFWFHLCNNEQAFLFEAIERVRLDSSLSQICISAIKEARNCHVKSSGEKIQHAMLLQNHKIISTYSSENALELECGDLLLIIGLSYFLLTDVSQSVVRDSGTEEHKINCFRRLIFLPFGNFGFIPFIIHGIKIYSGMIFVFVLKVENEKVAKSLCDCATKLSAIMREDAVIKKDMRTKIAMFESEIKTLASLLKKKNLDNRVNKLISLWTKLRREDLEPISSGSLQNNPSEKTIQMLNNLQGRIKAIFSYLFPANAINSEELPGNLEKIYGILKQRLDDYKDFVLVKGSYNNEIGFYNDTCPRLLHFVFLNRTTGKIITPYIDTGECAARDVNFAVVKELRQFGIFALKCGCNYVAVRKEDFFCTYRMWFEGKSNSVVEPERIIKIGNIYPLGTVCGDTFM
ncbi:Hermansky-Pudlak syndrome 1 protein-like protein [Trichoplax sp. H2]|nr:Hermansky-Pudlak syndrome 1 protein-like protein [Trichoplax sp. H2]|eukprot:RDD37160.1 Hermansky-Pudlak syndrome 1 protein-like protein [Trichoplax sp. H2]